MTVSSSLTPAVAGYDRSTSTRVLFHAPTHFGDRSFAAAGQQLWNSLPARIRQPDNDIGEFRRQLKSFLSVTSRCIVTFCFYAPLNTLTHSFLLTHPSPIPHDHCFPKLGVGNPQSKLKATSQIAAKRYQIQGRFVLIAYGNLPAPYPTVSLSTPYGHPFPPNWGN